MVNVAWAAEGYLLAGRAGEAQSLARRPLDFAREHKGRGYEADALRLHGEIASTRPSPDVEKSGASYRHALALAEETGMRPLVARCHAGLARLYRWTGKHQQAYEHFAIATTMYREMGMTYWLEKAEAEIREPG
jgi:hypothetical protein